MRDTLVMLIAELPTRGSLHYTVLREHLAELSRLQIMRSVVFDCVRERLEQESRSRGT